MIHGILEDHLVNYSPRNSCLNAQTWLGERITLEVGIGQREPGYAPLFSIQSGSAGKRLVEVTW